MRLSRAAFLTSLISILYITAFAVMYCVLMPIQVAVASEYVAFAQVTSLVILPHGVRVVATWLFRHEAIVFLFPGATVEAAVLAEHFSLGAGDLVLLILSFTTSSFIAFEGLRALGWYAYAHGAYAPSWRLVMTAGGLASLVSMLAFAQVDFGFATSDFSLWLAANVIIGGLTGLVAWLLLLRFGLRVFVRTL